MIHIIDPPAHLHRTKSRVSAVKSTLFSNPCSLDLKYPFLHITLYAILKLYNLAHGFDNHFPQL